MQQENQQKEQKNSQSSKEKQTESDIVNLILEDHKSLKELIKIMKESEKPLSERADAFAEFAPLLVTHAKPEEEVLYTFMKKEEELREEGFEGDVEHQLADQLIEEIKRTNNDDDLWSARVKVLAELVEHHIEEEEEELLPDFKKATDSSKRQTMGQQFLMSKTRFLEMGGEDTVPESELDKNEKTARH